MFFLGISFIPAQDLRLPRDPERLAQRVQRFWTALASGHRLQAVEFVVPEKKELFLSGNPGPVLQAKVRAIDLTDDPTRATVQISIDVLGKDLASQRSSWTITDLWIWRKGNWYVDLVSPASLFGGNEPPETLNTKDARSQLEKNFELPGNPINLGTLIDGQHSRIEVPIKYTGDVPISVELGLENPLIALDSSSTRITSGSRHLVLQVNTEDWDGPFHLQLPLTIRYQAAAIERTLLVSGNVFAPIAFRQDPPNGPIEVGREISIFIRNNSTQQVGIRYVSADAKFDIIKHSLVLVPNQEAEVVLKLKPNSSPDRFFLVLDAPLHGRDTYSYRFRNVRP